MNTLLDALSQILSGAGYVLDTPGALTRGLLSGRPGERASGRDMLESWGMLGPNQEGFDMGDVAGFGADLLVDPLNLVGAGMVKRTMGLADEAAASNKIRQDMLSHLPPYHNGPMPEDIAKLTKIVDEAGNPLRTLHGMPQGSNIMGRELVGYTNASFTNPDFASKLSGYQHYEKLMDDLAYLKERDQALGDIAHSTLSMADMDRHLQVRDLMNQQYFDSLSGARSGELLGTQELPGFPESKFFAGTSPTYKEFAEGFAARHPGATTNPYLYRSVNEQSPSYLDDLSKIEQLKRATEADLKDEWMLSRFKNPSVRMQYLDARNPYTIDYSNLPAPIHEMGDWAQSQGYDALIRPTQHGPEYNVFSPDQVYLPYVVPNQRRIPSANPILAAMAGSNALQTAGGY